MRSTERRVLTALPQGTAQGGTARDPVAVAAQILVQGTALRVYAQATHLVEPSQAKVFEQAQALVDEVVGQAQAMEVGFYAADAAVGCGGAIARQQHERTRPVRLIEARLHVEIEIEQARGDGPLPVGVDIAVQVVDGGIGVGEQAAIGPIGEVQAFLGLRAGDPEPARALRGVTSEKPARCDCASLRAARQQQGRRARRPKQGPTPPGK